MTKINITISDDERSFSATVDSAVEDIIQAVDAALQGLGWHYNTVRNTIYELYKEKMESDGLLTYESLEEKIKNHFAVPEEWDKHDYEIQRYSFEDLVEAAELVKEVDREDDYDSEVIWNDYVQKFCNKQELTNEGWVNDDIGGIAICSELYFNFRDIVWDINSEQPKGQIIDWYYENLHNVKAIDYYSYTKGLRIADIS